MERHAQAQGLARRISKAQQSCVSATALEQKIMRGLSIRINQKSMKKMVKNDQNTDQKPIKYQSKIDRKPIENQSTIDRKSIKNRPKLHQQFIKIEAWRGSGRILASSASWELFGGALV